MYKHQEATGLSSLSYTGEELPTPTSLFCANPTPTPTQSLGGFSSTRPWGGRAEKVLLLSEEGD